MRKTPTFTKKEALPSHIDTILIDGRQFKITRLPTVTSIETRKTKQKSPCLRDRKIAEASPADQKEMVRAILTKQKAEVLKAELGVRVFGKTLKAAHKDDLHVSDEQIENYLYLLSKRMN
ncbi:hypothetical protein OAA10_00250 [bacterium]|nr:hypothetical protein [bacterium]